MNLNANVRPADFWFLPNGSINWLPYLSVEERIEKGIPLIPQAIDGMRWTYEGKIFEVLKTDILPGVVFYSEKYDFLYRDVAGGKFLYILNYDNTIRIILKLPVLNEHSKPLEGMFYVPSTQDGNLLSVDLNDGHTDYNVQFDLTTGEVVKFHWIRF